MLFVDKIFSLCKKHAVCAQNILFGQDTCYLCTKHLCLCKIYAVCAQTFLFVQETWCLCTIFCLCKKNAVTYKIFCLCKKHAVSTQNILFLQETCCYCKKYFVYARYMLFIHKILAVCAQNIFFAEETSDKNNHQNAPFWALFFKILLAPDPPPPQESQYSADFFLPFSVYIILVSGTNVLDRIAWSC